MAKRASTADRLEIVTKRLERYAADKDASVTLLRLIRDVEAVTLFMDKHYRGGGLDGRLRELVNVVSDRLDSWR